MEGQKELGQEHRHEDQREVHRESHRHHGEHSSVQSLVGEVRLKSRVVNRSRNCHGRRLSDEWVQQELDYCCVGRATAEGWYWGDQ